MNNDQICKVKFLTKSTGHTHFDAMWKTIDSGKNVKGLKQNIIFLIIKLIFKLKVPVHRKSPMAYG